MGTVKRLKLRRLDPKGIPLSEVFAVHRQFSVKKFALKKNIGDGYLLEFNPVFRAVRRAFLAAGFRYECGSASLPHYASFPLMSLDDAISKRVIPYLDNAIWLNRLRGVTGFTLTELRGSELQGNYLFHESAHFIAHERLFSGKKPKEIPRTSDGLLRVMIGEAFANTAECVSGAFSEGEIGAFFLKANCHFRASREEAKLLLRTGRKFGFEKVCRVLLGAFLYSNYLYETLSARELARLRAFAAVENEFPLRSIANIGLQLNEEFRSSTTLLHLLKLGFPPKVGTLLQAEPLVQLEKDAALVEKTHSLATILCGAIPR